MEGSLKGTTFAINQFIPVRGVLGNKCAGQHNLKTVHFRKKLASGNFWHGYQEYVCFFAALYLP
jgi:hypothetical protein